MRGERLRRNHAGFRRGFLSRGFAEMTRFGLAYGAKRETLAGLSGLGDLVLTCTGELSRNRAHGLRLVTGQDAHAKKRGAEAIAEGVPNAKSIRSLAHKLKVDMPIVEAVYGCLYEERPPKAMVEQLLSRDLKPEF